MFIIESLLVALTISSTGMIDQVDSDFSYYMGELQEQKFANDHPMLKLIVSRLAESVFDTASSSVLSQRLYEIKKLQESRPDLNGVFNQLDGELQKILKKKVAEGRETRLLYSITGAVVGAIIAIPISKKLVSGGVITPDARALRIAVPSAALAGGTAGYLLGDLVHLSGLRQADQALKTEFDIRTAEIENKR